MKRSYRWYLIGGGILLAAVLFAAIFADRLTPVSPYYADANSSRLLPLPPFPPSAQHLLGTDELGRDVWTRVVYGARWSLLFAFLIMAGRMLVAVPMAFLGVYGPKRFGWFVGRLYVLTSAVPPLLMYLLFLSHPQLRVLDLWPSIALTVSLLTILEWPRLAVTLRGRIEQLNAEPFVEGAVAAGGTRWDIFRTHLLPHLWPTVQHMVASEMARSLVVIAQLGIFGIMMGGGLVVLISDGERFNRYWPTTGIPEWGSLLSDGRIDMLTQPWIPFPPACAFLIAVVGFNMLSQGLEGMRLSVNRVTQATTGRLSKRWRWALAVVPVAAFFWYHQGLPWGNEAAIADLVRYQSERLAAKDVDGFLTTFDQADRVGLTDMRRWAASLTQDEIRSADVTSPFVRVKGAWAKATWVLTIKYKGKPERTMGRETELVRRWGRWFETGAHFYEVRGYYTNTQSILDPIDPSAETIADRWRLQLIATGADHAFVRAAAFAGIPPGELPRPQVRFYPFDASFREAAGAGVPNSANVWYAEGEPIRISPNFLSTTRRWEIERSLSYEMIKFVTAEKLHEATINPVQMGFYEQTAPDGDHYVFYMNPFVGETVLRLDDMFAMKPEAFSPQLQPIFAAQSALLLDFLKPKLPAEQLRGPRAGTRWNLASLAERLGTTVQGLTMEYNEYVYTRLSAESILEIPAARFRIPDKLPEALADRAKAAASGDAEQFLALTDPAKKADWSKWLAAARGAGLERYESKLLEWDITGTNEAIVLERLQFRDGRVIFGLAKQSWLQAGGKWVVGPVSSAFRP